MNSRGIKPRVGMQFLNPSNGIRRRIVGFTSTGEVVCNGCIGCCGDYECTCTCLGLWNNGHYKIEWIPPTDEEREMFRNPSVDFFRWNWHDNELQHGPLTAGEIAESLSMDGT